MVNVWSVFGFSELDRKFGLLPDRVAKKAARKGIGKTSQRVTKDAKAKVRSKTKLLDKSLGFKVKTYPSGKTAGVVGPRRGYRVQVRAIQKKKIVGTRAVSQAKKMTVRNITLGAGRRVKVGQFIDPVKYGHLVERGHKRGKGRSAAPPHAFLVPSWRRHQATVQSDLREAIEQELRT